MACLGSVLYDPATVATKSMAAAVTAMAAFDTTNARITFTAPANGIVWCKLRVAGKGSATSAMPLLGVMEGSTVRARQVPHWAARTSASAHLKLYEAAFPITGLTPGNSYTFDAAWGVETFQTGSLLGYGGPNNATASDAYGALSFEVWEATDLLGAILYDPATAVSKDTATLAALTAIDTTNLRIAFTVPASGQVFVRLRGQTHGATTYPSIVLGVLEGSTVKLRMAPFLNALPASALATDIVPQEASAVVSGLTPAASLTWDAAYGVETVIAATGLKYGGPNNATANDAFGGFVFEVWEA